MMKTEVHQVHCTENMKPGRQVCCFMLMLPNLLVARIPCHGSFPPKTPPQLVKRAPAQGYAPARLWKDASKSGCCSGEVPAHPCPGTAPGHECFTLQAEGLQPELCAIEDNKAVRVVWSETRILLVPVKVTRVPSWTDLFDFTNIH